MDAGKFERKAVDAAVPKIRSGERLRAYRASYNYRSEYFKRNPGLFNCVWFCSQCFRPLIGRKNVVIDHIIPLSQGGRNHVSNCTAICQKCNRAKSDVIDGRIIRGGVFKLFESTLFRGQRGMGAALGVGVGLTAGAVTGTARVGKGIISGTFKAVTSIVGGVFKVVTFPIRKGSFISRLLFLAIYTLGILYVLANYTHLLDAWLLH